MLNTQPNIKPFSINGKTMYMLMVDHIFYFMDIELKVYRGFIYDGASIPWLAKPILKVGKDGVHRGGTLVHDILYMLEKDDKNELQLNRNCAYRCSKNITLSRRDADKIMFEIINTTNNAQMKNWKKNLMMFGIRVGGSRLWKKHTPLEKLNNLKCAGLK